MSRRDYDWDDGGDGSVLGSNSLSRSESSLVELDWIKTALPVLTVEIPVELPSPLATSPQPGSPRKPLLIVRSPRSPRHGSLDSCDELTGTEKMRAAAEDNVGLVVVNHSLILFSPSTSPKAAKKTTVSDPGSPPSFHMDKDEGGIDQPAATTTSLKVKKNKWRSALSVIQNTIVPRKKTVIY